jgi:hypothetical protein
MDEVRMEGTCTKHVEDVHSIRNFGFIDGSIILKRIIRNRV